jgi:DNA-binding GntR family transcriptional regulator
VSSTKSQNPSTRLTQRPLALYYQVATRLRNEIIMGTWSPGSQLPTEDEIVKEYGVSRQTVRNAKEMLAGEGFIRSIKGSGCYVKDSDKWKTMSPTVDNLNDIFHYGTRMSFKIHEFGMVSNSREIQNKLNNREDRFVFQIRGVRHFQGQPISCVVYYLPFRFASRISLDSLDENPFIPQFEKLAGIQVTEGIQTISLGRADRTVAENLGLKKGAPVLLVEAVYFDSAQRPIEYIMSRYRKELPYAIRIRRHSGSSAGDHEK